MKRLIFDYYRRWWLLYVILIGLVFFQGWQLARRPQLPFEFWLFILSLWAGANRLTFDFGRGLTLAMRTVPMTAKQIGRAWWFATVEIPAVAMAGLLIAGASLQAALNPGSDFPALALLWACLFAFVWLGTTFTAACHQKAAPSTSPAFNPKFLGVLSVLVLFGSMLKSLNLSHDPMNSGLLLSLGGFLTLASWVISGNLNLGRPAVPQNMRKGAQAPQLTPLDVKYPPPALVGPHGQGGLFFLLRNNFFKASSTCLGMISVMSLAIIIFGPFGSQQTGLETISVFSSAASSWIILVASILPLLPQIRFLRSMPVSPGKLAATLLLLPFLPLLAITVTMSGIMAILAGQATAWLALIHFVISWVPVPLCVCLMVWRGSGASSMLACLIIAVPAQMGLAIWHELLGNEYVQLVCLAVIVATNLFLGWLLLRLALKNSSNPFRPALAQSNPYQAFGGGKF